MQSEEYKGDVAKVYKQYQLSNFAGMMAFYFPIRILTEALLSIKTRRPYSTFSLKNSNNIDILMCILIAIRIGREYAAYQTGLSEYEPGSDELHSAYYVNIYVKEDDKALL